MFQNLSPGSTVYLLHREGPSVDVCRVTAANSHLPQFDPQRPQAMLSGLVTDLTVMAGEKVIPFAALPAASNTANFPEKGLFLADDRVAVINEVTAMRDNSRRIVESVEMHRKIAAKCEELLISLNPERQKEIKSAKELEELKKALQENRNEIAELKNLLSGFLKSSGKK